MYQLAIESSGLYGSVALLDANRTIAAISLPKDRSSVQGLAATVKSLLSQHGRSPDFISVTQGPGSFTGLRVGLATAKMLGLAWQVPLVAVGTLEVLALQILHRQPDIRRAILVPVINAFRRQVFTAGWLSNPDNTIIPIFPTQVVDAAVWVANPLTNRLESLPNSLRDSHLSSHSDPAMQADLAHPLDHSSLAADRIVVGGPGLENYRPGEVCQGCGLPVQLVEGISPEADWVGQIGWNRFQAGLIDSPTSLSANYVRASAAEDKLKA